MIVRYDPTAAVGAKLLLAFDNGLPLPNQRELKLQEAMGKRMHCRVTVDLLVDRRLVDTLRISRVGWLTYKGKPLDAGTRILKHKPGTRDTVGWALLEFLIDDVKVVQ